MSESTWSMSASYVTVDPPSADDTGEHDHVPTGVIGDEFREMELSKGAAAAAAASSFSFKNLDSIQDRTTEQTLNIMVVGESGMGKSTLIDAFFKTFREHNDRELVGEKTWKMKMLEHELLKKENELLVAHKELARLKDEDDLLGADEKKTEIARLQAEDVVELKAQIAALQRTDDENRANLEELKAAIVALKRDKAAAKRADLLTEAHALKLQLEDKEAERAELQQKLQTEISGDSQARHGPATMAPDGPGGPPIAEPTIRVTAKPPFDISHRVGGKEAVKLQVTLVDTPGYGDDTNLEKTFDTIVDYVDAQFLAHKRARERAKRPADASMDPLVHCCLYFIAPHRLKPVDLAFMRRLHKKVNIVPVVAKSDAMTSDEKRDFKAQVREALEKHHIDVFQFHKGVVANMARQAEQSYEHPWAVIATKDAKLEDGRLVALRRYEWGDADAANPTHSDLLALQTLILGEAEQWRDLKAATTRKFEGWREELLTKEADEAARPLLLRLHARALAHYSRVPPVYALSMLVLLLSLLLLQPLTALASTALAQHTESATEAVGLEIRLEMAAKLRAEEARRLQAEEALARTRRQIREWHAEHQKKAAIWKLPALPDEVASDSWW